MLDCLSTILHCVRFSPRLTEYVAQRKNILACRGTGSGKTTLANILTNFIPDDERMVLIEDTAEIQIQKPNVLRFEARRDQDGIPAVTIRDLLKITLRQRPDRIILGEIRGGEAFDLLQLLNTGHNGTISTVHANSALQGISRFTTGVLQSGIELPYLQIRRSLRAVRQWPMLPPRIGQHMFYRQIVWQAGRFVKFVPCTQAQAGKECAGVDAAGCSHTVGVRRSRCGIRRYWGSAPYRHRAQQMRPCQSQETRRLCGVAPQPQEHVVIVLGGKSTEHPAHHIAHD
jgi:energy-coupling factor transporter ATP-binding protein EcfA2